MKTKLKLDDRESGRFHLLFRAIYFNRRKKKVAKNKSEAT
jgi:hypothetical protein